MEVFIFDYLAFLLKSLTLVVLFALPIVLIAAAKNHKNQDETAQLKIKHLNDELEAYQQELDEHLLDKSALKKLYKARKQQKNTDATEDKARVFVLEFDGDMQASGSEHLADLLTILSARIREQDEVVVCLESGGGYVHRYGLAAAQLERLRQQQVKLTVCVDAVAASGGYMMAAVADTIYAAPFALIGSVGVVAHVPNFHRLLKKHEVDFEVLTAGEHKRTLTLFGENTPEGRDKFIEDLQKTHELFKQFVQQKRPQVEIKKIATGEVWYGQEALNLGLIDGLQTSQQYLQTRCQEANVYKISLEKPQPLLEKLGINLVKVAEKTWSRWQAKAQNLPKA